MSALLLHDPRLLSATIGKIYDCILQPEGWAPLMAELAALIGSRRATIGMTTMGGRALATPIAVGVEPDDPWEEYLALNPLLACRLYWPLDRAHLTLRDYGAEAFRASRYYREYLAPRGMSDSMVMLMSREGSTYQYWNVITHDDRGPITDEEAAGYELIAPHVRRAVEISAVFGAQQLAAETYRAALDQLAAVVLIVDPDGRPVFANPAAEAILARGQLLRRVSGRLSGATPAAEQALRRAMQAEGGFEAMLTGTDGEERLLFAVSLPASDDSLFVADRPSTLLVLRAPREECHNPVAIAARVFGLTAAQLNVLAFLAQGQSPEAIADILGVSVTTVRAHLAELFRRTNTARQAELVARTLSLASPLRGG